ncbi:Protein-(Glutamine-N5) methyltransferase,release factor-specific [Clostridium bornimense]|uniref:Release factor glutamine methyltransferase n=1 Tax=Clostridium bornimense TaxID=1216932 RepID=W6SIG2_9CLOT|nr:peptide chain release factor N(5)-glutamine methyltransferase [Clostridium bornimense]CDM69435.1 Protein-(Glutamine-N5) methyltransferase,release factor-specific [Clostridium bornimense]
MKIREALNKGSNILKESEIEYFKEDALELLSVILDTDKINIILNGEELLDSDKEEQYFNWIERRSKKEPLKYIIGYAEFFGLVLKVKNGVLIPRVDTETLVEEVIAIEKEKKNILDMCCGSGAIGIALAKNIKNVTVTLADISKIAEEVTKENIDRLDIENAKFIHSNLFENIETNRFDVIVSNPPYIRTDVIETLMEDVKDYEPHLALDGGEDGLYFYDKITKEAIRHLCEGGYLCYEIGYDQGNEVRKLMENSGFKDVRIVKDLAGNDRVAIGHL